MTAEQARQLTPDHIKKTKKYDTVLAEIYKGISERSTVNQTSYFYELNEDCKKEEVLGQSLKPLTTIGRIRTKLIEDGFRVSTETWGQDIIALNIYWY